MQTAVGKLDGSNHTASQPREAGEKRARRLHLLQQGGGGDGVGDWAGNGGGRLLGWRTAVWLGPT